MNITFRALNKNDIKDHFESNDIELDLFFKKYASQNQFKHYIGTTYVATVDNIIIGYVTVSASSIKISDHKNINEKLPQYPLPILRLSRLAVDKNYQNKGIGKQLLKFVLRLSIEQKNAFGCIGVVVDAKRGSSGFYKKFGFETIEIIKGDIDIRPFAETMYLSMKTILKAIEN